MLISRDDLHNKYYAALRLDPLSVAAIAAAVYFFDLRTLAALVCAACVHELGHIVCLRLFGLRLAGFRAETQGLCIEYTGSDYDVLRGVDVSEHQLDIDWKQVAASGVLPHAAAE